MKNVSKDRLKKCIFYEFEEYKELINTVTDGLKEVSYGFDDLCYDDTEKAGATETYWNKYITETLSEYFGVTVTSIHADDADWIGVWICYKEE
jgi:hypothetical protein